jgi:hypothetical protein
MCDSWNVATRLHKCRIKPGHQIQASTLVTCHGNPDTWQFGVRSIHKRYNIYQIMVLWIQTLRNPSGGGTSCLHPRYRSCKLKDWDGYATTSRQHGGNFQLKIAIFLPILPTGPHKTPFSYPCLPVAIFLAIWIYNKENSSTFNPEDGVGMCLQNIGIWQEHILSQPRRQRCV